MAGKWRVRSALIAGQGLSSIRYRTNPDLARQRRDAERPLAGLGCRTVRESPGGGPAAAARRVLRQPRPMAQLLAQCVAASAQSLGQTPCHIGRSCDCNRAMRPGLARPGRTIRAAWAQKDRVPGGVGGKTRAVRQQAPCSCRQTPCRLPGCPDTAAAHTDTAAAPDCQWVCKAHVLLSMRRGRMMAACASGVTGYVAAVVRPSSAC